jgi:hypothetical protein
MKTIKIMSIVGCVLFGLSIICIVAFMESDQMASMGWGIIGCFYGIALSIVGIVQSNKK